jgi:sphinganine-1-phosphate aldolase
VPYAVAKEAAGEPAVSGAIYGGVAGGLTNEVEEFIGAVMTDMLDLQQSLPPDAS